MTVKLFSSLSDYIAAQSADADLAAVLIPDVAKHLGITAQAVFAMLKIGKVDGVKIGSRTFVTVGSLKRLQSERDDNIDTIYMYLRELARNGTRRVYYQAVMREVGMMPAIPIHRGRIGGMLNEVSRKSHAEHGVLLSVLVHHKQTAGVTRPGHGFFEFAESLGLRWKKDPNKFVRVQTDRVLATYGK